MLSIQDLKFSIGDLQILNGVSFEIKAGEIVGIIGPNGSGKTTLFNCLSGFNKASSGDIVLNQKNINSMPSNERALAGLGRVFQNSGIFRDMTVLENVITALESRQPISSTFFPWTKQNSINRQAAL